MVFFAFGVRKGVTGPGAAGTKMPRGVTPGPGRVRIGSGSPGGPGGPGTRTGRQERRKTAPYRRQVHADVLQVIDGTPGGRKGPYLTAQAYYSARYIYCKNAYMHFKALFKRF